MQTRPILFPGLAIRAALLLAFAGCVHSGSAEAATRYGMNISVFQPFKDGVAAEKIDPHRLTGALEAYVNAIASGNTEAARKLHYPNGGEGMSRAEAVKAMQGHGKPTKLGYGGFIRRIGSDDSHIYEITAAIGFSDGTTEKISASLTTDKWLKDASGRFYKGSDDQNPTIYKFDIGSVEALQQRGDD